MERNRGLDLLRLLAGMAVVMLHYNYAYAFHYIDEISSLNKGLLLGMESLCIPAVNVFLIISGYFLYKTDTRSIGKVINLLLIVSFWGAFFYLSLVVLGKLSFNTSELMVHIAPNSYFIILYSAVYILSPYINIIIRKLSNDGVLKFVLLLTFVVCIEPWLIDELELLSGKSWNGLSTISHWGAQSGHTLVCFVYLYILGALLSRFKNEWKQKPRSLWGGLFISSSIIVFTSFCGLSDYITSDSYYSPFVVLQSISLFCLFAPLNSPAWVSKLSKAALVCYVIHFHLLGLLKINFFIQQPFYILLLHILLSLVTIYMIAFVAMTVYDFMFKKPINKLNQFKLNYHLDD